MTTTTTLIHEGWCPRDCNRWLCWPETPPGEQSIQDCPKVKGTVENAKAFRYCELDGTWEIRNTSNGSTVYTHFENCLLPQLQDLVKMCDNFGDNVCAQIGKITRRIEMVGLSFSLISLIISLSIFFSYRVLKNNRTKIHKNLFIATLLQVIFRLIKYINFDQNEHNKFLDMLYLNEANNALLEYAKTAMFMWMFIEGLYLHNMITVTVFQEYRYIKIYCYVGWLVPGVMTLVWLIVMIVKETSLTWEYYYFLNYYWILEGPRSTIIVINLLFLLNIIRVLVVKLKESRTREIELVRKAVRAAIFLLPLMGTAHVLFFGYKFDSAVSFAIWSYSAYFLATFQGFFVAVLYCFLNGEVQAAIKNSFYLHMSLRNYDYTPCRHFTIISVVGDEGSLQNGETSKWSRCCKPNSPTPEEKDVSTSKENWSSNNAIEETDTSLVEIKQT